MDVHGVAPLLQVFDMPTAIRFYRDVLGFTSLGQSQNLATTAIGQASG